MQHISYMQTALTLAEKGRYTVSPNPMVGSVIVKDDEMVGTGFHHAPFTPHAEIHALRAAGDKARGATLYVTLEPCCHTNRTPPCTDAIIAAGIRKVFVAAKDPNPKVSGKGLLQLQNAGIEVELGVLQKEAIALNEIFFHYIQHQQPFVIAKWAMSLDGKITTNSHDSKAISSRTSLMHTHETRHAVDAILIGAKTAIEDNPSLTVRYIDDIKNEPVRIILSSKGELPLDLNLLNDQKTKTIVATTPAISEHTKQALYKKNVEVLIIPANNENQVDLHVLMQELGKREMASILVEGGMQIHHSFFNANLVNKINVYLAPVIIAGLPQKKFLTQLNREQLASDHFFSANLGDEHV